MVPNFVTVHTLYVLHITEWYSMSNSDFLRTVATNSKVFCTVYDLVGKEDLSRGY